MKNKRGIFFVFLVITSLSAYAAGNGESAGAAGTELVIFNAASTTDLVQDLGSAFSAETGIQVKSSPASSGTLARQLEQGAGADIYISASQKWMDYVEALGICEETARFAQNRLVLISPAANMENFAEDIREILAINLNANERILDRKADLPSFLSTVGGRISIGDPAHVPAGSYAKEALAWFGWYEALENRIQPAADVRAAMAVVEIGECELGVVYETDARKSEHVAIIAWFPQSSHKPVVYYCALLKDAAPQAKQLFDFMLSDRRAEEIYLKYGFSLAEK
jgi:molybdate transport system substrate-binding protein